jgi:hypothetical protein
MNAAVLVLALVCAMSSPGQSTPPATPGATAAPSPAIALPKKVDAALRQRALDWWQARQRRDHQRMYDLFEPGYRKQVPFADFLKENVVRSRFDVLNPTVVAVVAESPERARVSVGIDTQPPGLPAGHVTAEDTWVRVSGQWFKVHETPSPFPVSR